MDKLNVLFLSAWYPNKYSPLNGNFIEKYAQAIAEFCRVNVLFVCPDPNLKKAKLEISVNKNLYEYIWYYPQTKCKCLLLQKPIKLFLSLFYTFKGILKIKKATKKIDITHVNILARLGVVALILKVIFKIPYIITEHWTGYLPARNKFTKKLKKCATVLAIKYSSSVTVVSKQLKEAMLAHNLTHKNYQIVYNIIDLDLFKIDSERKHLQKKNILHITNFKDDHKNLSGILRVVSQISKERTDFQLLVVGIGDHEDKYIKLAKELNLLPTFVRFLGRVENEELVALYNSSAFLLMFSFYETFQIPAIESLACGRPVLTTLCGGILDNTENKFGKIISPGNEKQLYQETINMLDNYQNYKPKMLRIFAENNFGKQKVALHILELYKNA